MALKERRQPQRTATAYVPKADSSYVARRIARHLADLERTNYTEPTTGPLGLPLDNGNAEEASRLAEEIEASSSTGRGASASTTKGGRRKQTHAVRGLLLYRKSLAQLIEESKIAAPTGLNEADGTMPLDDDRTTEMNYLTVKAKPSRYPPNELCSVCGNVSAYRCIRCGMMTCSIGCRETHDETRCERR